MPRSREQEEKEALQWLETTFEEPARLLRTLLWQLFEMHIDSVAQSPEEMRLEADATDPKSFRVIVSNFVVMQVSVKALVAVLDEGNLTPDGVIRPRTN